jgi:hypothetical protein
MSDVDKKIQFSTSGWFWTPKTEKEMTDYFNSFSGKGESSLVWLGASIAMNYILNKINNEFDVYKKGENNGSN